MTAYLPATPALPPPPTVYGKPLCGSAYGDLDGWYYAISDPVKQRAITAVMKEIDARERADGIKMGDEWVGECVAAVWKHIRANTGVVCAAEASHG